MRWSGCRNPDSILSNLTHTDFDIKRLLPEPVKALFDFESVVIRPYLIWICEHETIALDLSRRDEIAKGMGFPLIVDGYMDRLMQCESWKMSCGRVSYFT